jgi:hypothetical protein
VETPFLLARHSGTFNYWRYEELKRLSRLMFVTLSVGLVAAGTLAVQQSQRVTVESEGSRREVRNVRTDGYVRLVRQLSDAPCIQGRTWGYGNDYIWVSNGCRAIFEYGRYNDRNNDRYDDRYDRYDPRYDDRYDRRDDRDPFGVYGRRNNGKTVTVESDDGRRKLKHIDTRGGVRLVRQLSDRPCTYGRSWGYDQDHIWVDRGCRGVFEVGGRNGYGYGNGRNVPDWFPGRYRGYDNGREFYITIDRDGRVVLRRDYDSRNSRDEYGYYDDRSINVGDWIWDYVRSGNGIRLNSRSGRHRTIDLRRM